MAKLVATANSKRFKLQLRISSTVKKKTCPLDIVLEPDRNTGTCYDNLERIMSDPIATENNPVKPIFSVTNGIVYQDIKKYDPDYSNIMEKKKTKSQVLRPDCSQVETRFSDDNSQTHSDYSPTQSLRNSPFLPRNMVYSPEVTCFVMSYNFDCMWLDGCEQYLREYQLREEYVETCNVTTPPICYPNGELCYPPPVLNLRPLAATGKLSRKRKFSGGDEELAPAQMQLFMRDSFKSRSNSESYIRNSSVSVTKYFLLDRIWMLSHYLNVPNTSIWSAFNSKIFEDDSPVQRVSHLKTINASATDNRTVHKTLMVSKSVQMEAGQEFIESTYDLNMAYKALQLQSVSRPEFDSIFIHLGSFHLQMNYFHAVGKFIEDCGLTNVMVNAEIIGTGSVNGFVAGTHFNRCKRLHTIVTLGLQILLFERFLENKRKEVNSNQEAYVRNFTSKKYADPSVQDEELRMLFIQFGEYELEAYKGKFKRRLNFTVFTFA